MPTSRYDARLIPFTGGHEGRVLRWYRDPTGTGSIGYGFTWGSRVFRQWWLTKHGRKMRSGDRISEADAVHILKLIMETEYLPPVIKAIDAARATVSKHAVAASGDMAYNCGPGALGWSWFRLLLRGRVAEAAARYRVTAQTSKGRRLPGLVRRRKEGAAILEHDRWPSWLKAPQSVAIRDPASAMPDWRLLTEDVAQGQKWLAALGFDVGPADGKVGPRTGAAVLAFQQQHAQLDNDGILGRATLDQLQRTIDLKRKAARSTATGGATSAAGGAETATGTDVTGVPEFLIWGGVAIVVIAGLWLAWRYRDELTIAARSLTRRT